MPRTLSPWAGRLLTCLAVAGSLSAPRPAPAAPAPTTFYQGRLSGGDIHDWTLYVATRGRDSYGATYGTGGPAPDDQPLAARLRGSYRNRRVNATIFSLPEDGSQPQKVGSASGQVRRAGRTERLQGTFRLAGRSGTLRAAPVPRRRSEPFRLAGNYSTENPLLSRIEFHRNGTFRVVGVILIFEVTVASGVWMEDRSSHLWMLPLSVNRDLASDQVLLQYMPLRLRFTLEGEQLTLFDPLTDDRPFLDLTRQ